MGEIQARTLVALVGKTPVGNGSVQGGYGYPQGAVVAAEAINEKLWRYVLEEEVVVTAPPKAEGVAYMAEIGIVGMVYGSTGVCVFHTG